MSKIQSSEFLGNVNWIRKDKLTHFHKTKYKFMISEHCSMILTQYFLNVSNALKFGIFKIHGDYAIKKITNGINRHQRRH